MSSTSAHTVHASIVVDAPIERAFAIFTEQFGRFKPPEHNMLGVEIAETVFEPRVGGHLYDRGVAETEASAGRQPQQIDAARCHILAHLPGRHGETPFSEFVMQLSVDQVHLT